MGSPFYSTARIFSFTKRTKLHFDSVRFTQIDISFQQVVLQLRRRLGTTTDPVFLYPRPRSWQIENFPSNSLIHNLSWNIKSGRDFYVMKSIKGHVVYQQWKYGAGSYKLFTLNKCKCLHPATSNPKTMSFIRDRNGKHLSDFRNVPITLDYYGLICEQRQKELIIRKYVLTVGWFYSHDFQE